MRFTKMQGAGNDYVYVNCLEEPLPKDPAELARRISDRHFGVGGDGLILICPSDVADARMRMFNADGSEAEMCGNGVRCVAKYVYDHGISRKPTLKIETGRGVLSLELEIAGEKVRRVRVDMGEPILEPARIPVKLPCDCDLDQIVDFRMNAIAVWEPIGRVAKALRLGGSDVPIPGLYKPLHVGDWDARMTCVSMGNPHAVFYYDNPSESHPEWLGQVIETLPIFPNRINVHFVKVQSPGEVTMKTWERGTGTTLACGTGACAVCVAGVLTGRTQRKLLAHLPGGDLELEWAENNHVFLTGAAVEVFAGEMMNDEG